MKGMARAAQPSWPGDVPYPGIVRSLLALSTLTTLLRNDWNQLIVAGGRLDSVEAGIWADKINLFSLFPQSQVWIPGSIACMILIWSIWGVHWKLCSLFHWWVSFSFFHSVSVPDGGDSIARNLTLLLIPFCLSDYRKNHWHGLVSDLQGSSFREWVRQFSISLLRIQVALIYFDAAFSKGASGGWRSGLAPYYIFQHPVHGSPLWLNQLWGAVFSVPLLLTGFTWSVLALEFLACISPLLSKNLATRVIAATALFHGLVILNHGLFSFALTMWACLLILRPEAVISVMKSVSRSFSGSA